MAFSLENYQKRLDDNEELKIYKMELLKEAKTNKKSIDFVSKYLKKNIDLASKAKTALKNKNYNDPILFEASMVLLSKPSFYPRDQVYNTMINSNGFRLFKNIEIKTSISEFYKMFENLKELIRILNENSSKSFVKYHFDNFDLITMKTRDDQFYKKIEFGNHLMSYIILSSQLKKYYDIISKKADELIILMNSDKK